MSRPPFITRSVVGLPLLVLVALLSGCAHQGERSSSNGLAIPLKGERYLVLGVGLITVSSPRPDAAVAVHQTGLGLQVSNQPGVRMSLGYASSQVVTVPADLAEDVRLSVSSEPGQPMRVTVDSARIQAPFSHP